MNQRYRYEDPNRGQYGEEPRDGRRGGYEDEAGRGRRYGAAHDDNRGGRFGGGQRYRQDPGQGFSRDYMGSGAYASDEESQDYFDYYGQGRPTRHGYGDPDAGRSSAFRSYGGRSFNESPREGQREGQRWFDQQGGYGGGEDMYDRQRQGQGFRGKGPKGYQRTNERLLEDINERLMDDDGIDASEITVQCRDGVVTLEGTVSDRWMKYRAEDLIERCHGVKDIENRLRVSQGGRGHDDEGSTAGQEGGGSTQKKKH